MDGTFHAYRTVVLSDVHLGSSLCDIARVNAFLEGVRCEHLILNGDIIDCWALRRGGVWGAEHTRFIGLLLAKVRHHRTRVVYVRGNHDDVLGRLLPLALDNLSIVEEHVHTMGWRDYLVVHGDASDAVVRHNQLTTAAGNLSYHMLMAINSVYNWMPAPPAPPARAGGLVAGAGHQDALAAAAALCSPLRAVHGRAGRQAGLRGHRRRAHPRPRRQRDRRRPLPQLRRLGRVVHRHRRGIRRVDQAAGVQCGGAHCVSPNGICEWVDG